MFGVESGQNKQKLMKILFLVSSLILVSCASSNQQVQSLSIPNQSALKGPDEYNNFTAVRFAVDSLEGTHYLRELAKVYSGDSANYLLMRLAYFKWAERQDQLVRNKRYHQLIDVLEEGDLKLARMIVEEQIAENWVDLEAHLYRKWICQEQKDKKCVLEEEHNIARLADSYLKTGDGKKKETAIIVGAVYEEYTLMRMLGMDPGDQSLVSGFGHQFDRIKITNPEGENQDLFFNVDLVFWGYNRKP